MSTLAPGTYFGKLIEASFGVVGKNETPACVLTFEVSHFARNGGWDGIDPVTRDVMFYLSDNAREYAFKDMAALGFNGDFDHPKFAEELSATGTELDVIHELYQGKTSEKVTVTKLKKGRDRKPVDANFKHALAAQYRTTVQSSARPSAPPPARPAAQAVAPAAASRPAPTPPASVGDNEPPF